MRALLRPPVFATEAQTSLARLLHPMLLTGLAVNGLGMLLLALVAPPNVGRYELMGVGYGLGGLSLLALEQRGQVRLASVLWVGGLWSLTTGFVLTTGGVLAPAFMGYLVIVVIAGLLLGGGAGVGLAALTALAGLGMVLVETARGGPSPTAWAAWLNHTAFMAVIALLQALATRTTRQALAAAHANASQSTLIHERDFLQALMDNIPDTIYFKDTQSRFTRINRAEAALLGVRDPSQALGKTDSDFQPAHLARAFLAEEQRIVETGQPVIGRIEYNPTPDGRPRWLSSTKVPIQDVQGRVTGLVGISRDITTDKQAEENLRRSEERLRLAFDPVHTGIWDWDILTNAVTWSENVEAIFGLPPGEFDGTYAAYQQLIHPDDRPVLEKAIAAALSGEVEPYFVEHRIFYPDGTVHWLEGKGVVYRSPAGEPVRMMGKVFDITARKQIEEALRASEEKFSKAFRSGPDAVTISRVHGGQFLEVNDGFERMSGYSRAEALGRSAEALGIWAEPANRVEMVQLLHQHGRVRDFETILRHRSGEQVNALLSVELIELDGAPCMVVTTRDISRRKQAETALHRHTQRLEILHEVDRAILALRPPAEMALAALTRLRHLIPVARASVSLFDFTAGQLALLAVSQAHPVSPDSSGPMSLEDYGQPALESLQQGQPYLIKDVLAQAAPAELDQRRARDGLRSWLMTPLVYHGELIGALNLGALTPDLFMPEHIEIARQLADQMAVAIQQSRLFEAVQNLNTELEARVAERTAQLEQANHELESFSYSISHDLRTPLRGLIGFSRILLDDYAHQLDTVGQHHLQRIRDSAHNMNALIDNLLEFSRLGRHALKPQALSGQDVRDLVEGPLRDLLADTGERQIDVTMGELPACQADPTLLKQVWANLIGNALKYTRHRAVARIKIGAQNTARGLAYYVRDNGAGFDMRYADKLFGVFQRLHGADEFEGTGVGLAIGQRIVERHGGRIWAEAEVDQGATFYFTLPEKH